MPNRTYVDTLRRSSFVFAPGGAGPYTFRLIEAMAAGAVPVVTAVTVLLILLRTTIIMIIIIVLVVS
ncbi:hypothetical protein T492DRAFT_259295 [Pavlovales sp. CCMP2436]|nr:hypothetical protein T492DRAFT_259295 [Pavlovales sp. CCMP2436]